MSSTARRTRLDRSSQPLCELLIILAIFFFSHSMYQLQKNIKFDLMMAYGLIRRYLKKCNTAEHRYNHSIMIS